MPQQFPIFKFITCARSSYALACMGAWPLSVRMCIELVVDLSALTPSGCATDHAPSKGVDALDAPDLAPSETGILH